MEELVSKLAIWVVCTLFGGLVAVLVYLWKQRDSEAKVFVERLDRILLLVNNTNNDITGIKKDLGSSVKAIDSLERKEEELSKMVASLRIDVSMLKEFKYHQQKLNNRN